MNTTRSLLPALLALAGTAYAVETRFWQQTEETDFEKGTLNRLSLRSDGRIYLAPSFSEVFDSAIPYLWAIVADAKGNVYTGGGGGGSEKAKLFAIDAAGKSRTVAEIEGLEIHALAVDPAGQIYAATDPDGKIYRITPAGNVQPFYDPHAKYIWAMVFDSKGALFVATGDRGEVHRVSPDGKGSVFFKTEETHARSLALDSKDNLIIGTEPGGLVIRVSPDGRGFVLYQTPKREVTAIAVAPDGGIYAASVGNRAAGTPSLAAPPTPPAVTAAPAPVPGTVTVTGRPNAQAAPAPAAPVPPPITGGSEVYRIDADGSPRRFWSNAQDIVYAIGFDLQNRPLIGTGNRGKVYRIDSANMSTLLLDTPPTQITGFAAGPRGRLYAITGNIGKLYEIGPGLASKGVFESDVLDAGAFSSWGRLSFRGSPADAEIYTRSGNVNRPQDNWSPWAPLRVEHDSGVPACSRCLNGQVTSPSARFMQYKVELSAKAAAPELASIEVAYLAKNFAPVIDEIEITPPNYKFPAPSAPLAVTAPPLSLPPLGQKKRSSSSVGLDLSSSQALTFGKGWIGARWAASDENGDSLACTVEIRGVNESGWKLLKEKLREKYYSWDSTAFPDGEYEVRVTVSDSPSNPPAESLTATLTSEPFLIDNTPPQILNLTATISGNRIQASWKARDARSIIDHAEYSLNGGDWTVVQPTTRLSDAPEEDYRLSLDRSSASEQTIAVRVTDSYDNQAVAKTILK